MEIHLTTPAQGRRRVLPWRNLLRLPNAGMLLSVTGVTLFFYALNHTLLAPVTVTSILNTMAYSTLVGMGLAMLLIAGEMDLSTASVMSLCAVAAAWLMTKGGLPAWAGVAGALVLALGIGLVNGLLTVKVGAPSLVATLAVGLGIRGAANLLTRGVPIYPLPPEIGAVGALRPLGMSVTFVLMLVVLAVTQIILSLTRWGAMVYATGGNKAAAEQCGIHPDRVKIACFMLTSLLAACAGLLTMCQIKAGDPAIGSDGLEVVILTGVIIGGVSFFGGRGSAVGAFLGILLLQVLFTGLIVAHFKSSVQGPITGAILATVAAVDVMRHRKRA
jgi:ribose transport system permease protein